jgi:hypothetical protein
VSIAVQALRDFKFTKDFLVGIDSDGSIFDKFIRGEYAGEYKERLIAEFDSYLPENSPWEV